MKINKFKLQKEDSSHYHVMTPGGKILTVQKDSLSKHAQAVIEELKKMSKENSKEEQHLYSGGGVNQITNGGSADSVPNDVSADIPASPEPGHNIDAINNFVSDAWKNATDMPLKDTQSSNYYLDKDSRNQDVAQAQQTIQDNIPDQPIVKAADLGTALPTNNPYPQMNFSSAPSTTPGAVPGSANDAYNQMIASNEALGKAEQAKYGALGKQYGDYATKIEAMPHINDLYKQGMQKDADLEDAYRNAKIDPNKLWHDSSTPSKIAAGIGVLLSGIGSGLTGQPNMAVSMIEKAMDRDIDAQKNDKSDKFNLWKMNREKVQSDLQADLLTRNQYLAGMQVRLDQTANTMQGPVAKAQRDFYGQQIRMQQAQNNQYLSMLNPNSAEAQGNAPEGTEEAYVHTMNYNNRAGEFIPALKQRAADMQSKYIAGMGTTDKPMPLAEQTRVTQYGELEKMARELQQVQLENKGGIWYDRGRVANLEEKFQAMKGAAQELALDVKRYNPGLADLLTEGMKSPDSMDWLSKNANRFGALADFAHSRQQSTLKQFAFKPFPVASEDQKAHIWLSKNPNDPDAPAISGRLQKRGLL